MGIHPYPHALWITLCMLALDCPRGPSPLGGPAHGQKSAISRIAYEIKWLPVERRVNVWAEAVEQPLQPPTTRLCTTDRAGLALGGAWRSRALWRREPIRPRVQLAHKVERPRTKYRQPTVPERNPSLSTQIVDNSVHSLGKGVRSPRGDGVPSTLDKKTPHAVKPVKSLT